MQAARPVDRDRRRRVPAEPPGEVRADGVQRGPAYGAVLGEQRRDQVGVRGDGPGRSDEPPRPEPGEPDERGGEELERLLDLLVGVLVDREQQGGALGSGPDPVDEPDGGAGDDEVEVHSGRQESAARATAAPRSR
ncbi:hypothetical protein GCM10027062_37250 [Nocardioides hungaricus]